MRGALIGLGLGFLLGADWARGVVPMEPGTYVGGFGGLGIAGKFVLDMQEGDLLAGRFSEQDGPQAQLNGEPLPVSVSRDAGGGLVISWEDLPLLPAGAAELRPYQTPYGLAYFAAVPYEEDEVLWSAQIGFWTDESLDHCPFVAPPSTSPELETRGDGYFRWWGAEPDGLANDATRALIQTSDGFLWVGTVDGLSRFDGQRWVNHNVETAPELPGHNFRSLLETRDGALVALIKHHGLYRLRDDGWEGFACNPKLEGLEGGGLLEDPEGALWFAADSERLARVDHQESLTFWPVDQILPLRSPEDSRPPSLSGGIAWQDRILFTSSLGVGALNPRSSPEAYWFPSILGDGARVIPGIQGAFWASSLSNVVRYDRAGAVVEYYSPRGYSNTLRYAIPRQHGGVWVVGGNGLFAMPDPSRMVHYTKVPSAATEGVAQALEDREGNLWIATSGRGLCQYVPNPFEANTDPSLAQAMRSGRARPISLDLSPSGDLMMAAGSFVGRRALDGAWDVQEAYRGMQVSTVALESEDAYWIGVTPHEDQRDAWRRFGEPSEGFPFAVRVGPTGTEPYYLDRRPEGLADISTMIWAPDSGAWIGTEEGLWVCREGAVWSWDESQALPPAPVAALLKDSKGVWVANANQGVFHVSTSAEDLGSADRDPQLARTRGVLSLALGGQAEGLWFGSETGVHWWAGDGTVSIRDVSGNVGRPVSALLEDREGNLWAGSSAGIHCLPRASVEAVLAEPASWPEWRLFGKRDGLEKTSVESSHFPSATQAGDGTVYFCMQGALVAFQPEELLRSAKVSPDAHITRLGDGENLWWSRASSSVERKERTWPPVAGRRLQVSFASTHLTQPEALSFRYRIPSRDAAWTDLGAQRSVWVFDLGHGRHAIELQATDHHQRRGSIDSIAFHIAPRWHERLLVRGSAFLVALSVDWFWQDRRARQKVHAERLRSQLRVAEDRRRIARDMHDEIGANFAQLKILGELLQADRVQGPAARDTLGKMVRLAREGSQTLREILWSVGHHSDRDERDLGEFMRSTMEKLLEGATTQLTFDYHWNGTPPSLSPLFKREVILVTKGVVTNVIRHAQARHLQCGFHGEGEHVVITWVDDGVGFDPSSVDEGTLGLRSIRERVEAWGGGLSIDSEPGMGVRLTVRMRARRNPSPNHDEAR